MLNEEEKRRIRREAVDYKSIGGKPLQYVYEVVKMSEAKRVDIGGHERLEVVRTNGRRIVMTREDVKRQAESMDGFFRIRTAKGLEAIDPGDIPPGYGLAVGVPDEEIDLSNPYHRRVAALSGIELPEPGAPKSD